MVEYIEEKGKNCPNKEVATNVMEAIKLLEYLVQMVDDSNNRKLSVDTLKNHLFIFTTGKLMLNLLIPLLISLLESTSLSNGQRLVHAYTLERLKLMGPKYPAEFKSIIASNPQFKKTLESALKSSQEVGKISQSASSTSVKQPAQPTIKLKMDFSNFK